MRILELSAAFIEEYEQEFSRLTVTLFFCKLARMKYSPLNVARYCPSFAM